MLQICLSGVTVAKGFRLLQVRNRTQAEIDANLSASEAAQREDQFFGGDAPAGMNPRVMDVLKALPPDKKGKKALVDLLLKVQGSRLQGSLISLKKKVNQAQPRQLALSSDNVMLLAMRASRAKFSCNKLTLNRQSQSVRLRILS